MLDKVVSYDVWGKPALDPDDAIDSALRVLAGQAKRDGNKVIGEVRVREVKQLRDATFEARVKANAKPRLFRRAG